MPGASSAAAPTVSSRLMKSGSRNRPFAKDLHDLFATLIVSLRLFTHRTLFKSYAHTFTTDEAVANLSALKFSQSSRTPDPKEPSRVVTTTTTTTFTMNRDIAKDICQHFLDARLLRNAAEASGRTFRDKGIWALTLKGYCILGHFVSVNGISADHLEAAINAHRPLIRLNFLERRAADDEINVRLPLLDSLFRRFAGSKANYPCAEAQFGSAQFSPEYFTSDGTTDSFRPDAGFNRARGIEMSDMVERLKGGQVKVIRHAFNAVGATEWLLDYTTACGRDEAAELLAHFERLDLIKLVVDKPRPSRTRADARSEPDIVSVRGADVGGMITEGEFRCHYKSVYALTDRGREVARWEGSYRRPSPSEPGQAATTSATHLAVGGTGADARFSHDDDEGSGSIRSLGSGSRDQMSEVSSRLGSGSQPGGSSSDRVHRSGVGGSSGFTVPVPSNGSFSAKDQGTRNKLRQILANQTLCELFQAHLQRNFCEENLSFYLDVQDFNRRFNTTSSASAVHTAVVERPAEKPAASKPRFVPSNWLSKTPSGSSDTPAQEPEDASAVLVASMSAMERHHLDLIVIAFLIFNTYLAPGAPAELNLESSLRTELLQYMAKAAPGILERSSHDLTDENPGTASTPRMTALELGLPEGPNGTGKKVPVLALEERKKIVLARIGPAAALVHASQLQTLLRLYNKIQAHVFQLMATDSVPRFLRDPDILAAMEEHERERTLGLPPGVRDLLELDSLSALPAA